VAVPAGVVLGHGKRQRALGLGSGGGPCSLCGAPLVEDLCGVAQLACVGLQETQREEVGALRQAGERDAEEDGVV
jgi:hypothetical protein